MLSQIAILNVAKMVSVKRVNVNVWMVGLVNDANNSSAMLVVWNMENV